MKKGEGGSHEEEGFAGLEVIKERGEVKFGMTEEEAGFLAIIEVVEHVTERGLGGFGL
jgi:hypothetical protein